MTFVCEDEDAKPTNAWGDDQVEFEGIQGSYVKI